jgi:lipid A 3-O-deacylase
MTRCRWPLLVGLLTLVAPGGAHSAEIFADSLMVGAGRWGLKSGDHSAVALELEYRHRPLRWGLFPLAGMLANSDQGWSLRFGLGRELPFGERWDATATFAAAAYFAGQGKDLGHTLEFRSALDIGVRVRPSTRVGLSVAHFSNAGLASHNPGIEALSLTVTYYPPRAWLRPGAALR